MAKKLDARAFAQTKRNRRKLLTFLRMCRYGVNNFSRNAWLSLAATAVMTITLLVIFVSVAAHNVLVDTVTEIRSKVDMSIYLKSDTSDADASHIADAIRQLSTVKSVSYVSPQQAREAFAEQNKQSIQLLNAVNEANAQFPGTLHVSIVDINNPQQLSNFVSTDSTVKEHIDPNRPASFAGDRRTAISNIGRWISFAQQVGIGATIIFVAISSLIVFNTIRMAIFNRKEEIQMMKLIGADRGFIRGPFIVEAVFSGFIAAVVATTLGMLLLYSTRDKLMEYQVAVQSTIQFMTAYFVIVILAMICIGALIGIISSLFATRRYLKI